MIFFWRLSNIDILDPEQQFILIQQHFETNCDKIKVNYYNVNIFEIHEYW